MKFQIEGKALLWWAVLLLILPLQWLICGLVAAIFHELCHLAAIYALGETVYGIRLTGMGAVMVTPPMEPGKELICALAGPVGGLMLLALSGSVPMLALWALFHSVYNLLPVYPLDGGRALSCLLALLWPQRDLSRILRWASVATVAVVTVLCLRFSLYVFLVLPLALVLKSGFLQKYLAKLVHNDYNIHYHK